MRISTRILVSFVLIYLAGFYFLSDSTMKDMRPRYLEAVEESLNDTAHLLASLLESDLRERRIQTSRLDGAFHTALGRKLSAQIYGLKKTGMELGAYVTDARGIVLFDSSDPRNVGRDFSRWNDVHLTLRGRYGARSTRLKPEDPASSMLYVAAPVRLGNRIIGVLTVFKSQDSVTPFIEIAKRKLFFIGLVVTAAAVFLSLVLSYWIGRPLRRLTAYVQSLKTNESARLPLLSGREIQLLGKSFEELWQELRGKKYIEEYVQALTHELKSPLTSLRGSAELLEEAMPEEQRKKFYGNILRETRRMEEIIERLLELSSLERRRRLEDVETIPLSSLFTEVSGIMEPSLTKKRITLIAHADPGLTLRGERFLMKQALLNLLENALRFTPEGGTIRADARREGDSVIIGVRDSGSGIPAYALDKIFDRFYSLPGPGGKKSTGLGLPFVREAVSLHGGRIEIINNEEGGVTATLVFPQKI